MVDDKEKEKDKEKKMILPTPNDAINALLVQKKPPKHFPPRKMVNPFDEAQQEQEKILQARRDALLKYSEISKNRFKRDEAAPLRYVIRPGNNSMLLSRVFAESGRHEPSANEVCPGWEPCGEDISLFNFKWKPVSCGINYDLISKHGIKQIVSHMQGHHELTTKDNLFLNLKQYYESQKLASIFDVVPLTFVLDYMKDNVGEQVQQFLQINKMIDRVIQRNQT